MINTAKTISFSQISCYNNCPFKFKQIYIDKVRDVSGISAVCGISAHNAIDFLFKNKNCSYEDIIYQFEQNIKKQETNLLDQSRLLTEITITKNKIKNIYNFIIEKNLLKYKCKTELKIERKFRDYTIKAVIDIIIETEDCFYIFDWKFGKAKEEHVFQLFFYKLLLGKTLKNKKIICSLIYSDKPKIKEIIFDKNVINSCKIYILDSFKKLKKDTKFQPTSNRFCKYCHVQKKCSELFLETFF